MSGMFTSEAGPVCRESSELKPYPFCGSSAKIIKYPTVQYAQNIWFYHIGCEDEKCTLIIGPFFDEKDAMKGWNKRSYEC